MGTFFVTECTFLMTHVGQPMDGSHGSFFGAVLSGQPVMLQRPPTRWLLIEVALPSVFQRIE